MHIISTVDKVFRALADQSRRQLLDSLYSDDGQTLGELCSQISMSRQAGSKHLRILEQVGLVAIHWQGREKLHYLNPVPIAEIYERWMDKFSAPRSRALTRLKKQLERPDK